MVLQGRWFYIVLLGCLFFLNCEEKKIVLNPETIRLDPISFSYESCDSLGTDSVYSDLLNLNGSSWDEKEILDGTIFRAVSFNDFGNDTIIIKPLLLLDSARMDVFCSVNWAVNRIEHERILETKDHLITIDTEGPNIIFNLCNVYSGHYLGSTLVSFTRHSVISFPKP